MAKKYEAEFCSFCGRGKNEASMLIAGQFGAYICSDCARQANEYVLEELAKLKKKRSGEKEGPLMKPREITAFLDNYVSARRRLRNSFP